MGTLMWIVVYPSFPSSSGLRVAAGFSWFDIQCSLLYLGLNKPFCMQSCKATPRVPQVNEEAAIATHSGVLRVEVHMLNIGCASAFKTALLCSVAAVCFACVPLHAVCTHRAPSPTTRRHQSQLTVARTVVELTSTVTARLLSVKKSYC